MGQLAGWHCLVVRLLVPRLHGTRLLRGPRTDGQSREGPWEASSSRESLLSPLAPTPERAMRFFCPRTPPPASPYLLSCDWIPSKQTGSVAAARNSFLMLLQTLIFLSRKTLYLGVRESMVTPGLCFCQLGHITVLNNGMPGLGGVLTPRRGKSEL